MNSTMMFLMTLRIYSSTDDGIQVNHYGALYHLIILGYLVILLVHRVLVQLLRLQICLWTYLITFILMLLKSIYISKNKLLTITVSLVAIATPTLSAMAATTTLSAMAATTILSDLTAPPTPSEATPPPTLSEATAAPILSDLPTTILSDLTATPTLSETTANPTPLAPHAVTTPSALAALTTPLETLVTT